MVFNLSLRKSSVLLFLKHIRYDMSDMPKKTTKTSKVKKSGTKTTRNKPKPTKRSKNGLTKKLPFINKVKTAIASRPKWQRIVIYTLTALLLLFGVHRIVESSFNEVDNPQYGVSFSVKYAEELGVDWRDNFTALLDDMELRHFRLMSYWDEHEPEKGVYVFDDLDWQMEEAHKRGAKVSLALGMRQPRWPECHKPNWYNDLNKKQQDEALFDFVEVVVERYKDHPALLSYQLENEAVNTWFGECTAEDIDKQRLIDEFQHVKQLDPNTPVWMSLSDQHGPPLREPVPDRYGYSVYRTVYNDKTGPFKFYLTYPTPVWYHKLRAQWIELVHDRNIFIHELQLEPWGPVGTAWLDVEEQDKSMDVDQIRTNVNFARKIGTPLIYTWGGEWWYWRMTEHNDPSIWEAVREEFNRQ